jgi:hypothetical protein
MLESNLFRRALEMDVGPSAFVEFVGALQARVGRSRRSGVNGDGDSGEKKQSCEAHDVNSCWDLAVSNAGKVWTESRILAVRLQQSVLSAGGIVDGKGAAFIVV